MVEDPRGLISTKILDWRLGGTRERTVGWEYGDGFVVVEQLKAEIPPV